MKTSKSATSNLFAGLLAAGTLFFDVARADDPGDSVFTGIRIHKINLVFPQTWSGSAADTAAWTNVRATLRTNKEPEVYIPAKLEINCDATRANAGCILMDSIGVRYKGNSTYSATREKNPFRISFDEYGLDQRWNGVKGFVLNNANSDGSHMAEKIHMDFAVGRAGMPGPRFAYADVFINGFPYSFYLMGELADGRLLQNHFGENDGDLFKAIDGLSSNSDFTTASFTNRKYEYKGDSATRAWARLGAVITAVNGSNVGTALPPLVNLNSVYRTFATDILFGSTDSYLAAGQNYLLYFPEAPDAKMEWVLWDASLSFGKAPFGGTNTSSTPGGNCSTASNGSIVCGPTNRPLINKIVTTQSLREDYLRAFWFHYKAYYEGDWLTKRIDTVASLIRPYVMADARKLATNFDADVTTIKTFVTNRQASVTSQFATQGISAANAIRNGDIAINEVAPAQGWVEVYNNRSYAIDLSGHSLSNDGAQPNKWTFPPATFVPSGGFRKVRLQGGQGTDTATNFSLPTSGGHLRFSRADGTVVDSVTFGAVNGVRTVARLGDGTGSFGEGIPTPGAANIGTAGLGTNVGLGVIRINEFMADNDTVVSPVGNKPDWVELYNTSSSGIGLEGMYLSDNGNNPGKWKFPTGTTIGANAYLVVWAYDTTLAGSVFTTWSLSKDGEHVRLSNADLSVVDSVTFGAQVKSRTMARIPNGTGAFSTGCSATPAAENSCTTTRVAGGAVARAEADLALVRGGAGRVATRFTMPSAGPARLSVYDARGREVAVLVNERLGAGRHERVFDPRSLPSGTYWFRLRAGKTDRVRAVVLLR